MLEKKAKSRSWEHAPLHKHESKTWKPSCWKSKWTRRKRSKTWELQMKF
jgi:hypothetical protein